MGDNFRINVSILILRTIPENIEMQNVCNQFAAAKTQNARKPHAIS